MRHHLATAFLSAAALVSFGVAPAHAQDPTTDLHLRFRHLEFSMAYDPMLATNDPHWLPHHTPREQLEDAASQLRAFVPVGTPATEAMRRLGAAGAKCAPTQGPAIRCRYFDVQTRGDFLDDVNWIVVVGVNGDQVTDLAVDRVWTRELGN